MTGHRRAIVFLGVQQIERMLALPEGMRVLAARDDFMRNGIGVLVEGDMLEEQPEHCVLPDVPVSLLDRTELAMRARVIAWGSEGGGAFLEVRCPMESCPWVREWADGSAMVAMLADAVQQHLSETHAS